MSQAVRTFAIFALTLFFPATVLSTTTLYPTITPSPELSSDEEDFSHPPASRSRTTRPAPTPFPLHVTRLSNHCPGTRRARNPCQQINQCVCRAISQTGQLLIYLCRSGYLGTKSVISGGFRYLSSLIFQQTPDYNPRQGIINEGGVYLAELPGPLPGVRPSQTVTHCIALEPLEHLLHVLRAPMHRFCIDPLFPKVTDFFRSYRGDYTFIRNLLGWQNAAWVTTHQLIDVHQPADIDSILDSPLAVVTVLAEGTPYYFFVANNMSHSIVVDLLTGVSKCLAHEELISFLRFLLPPLFQGQALLEISDYETSSSEEEENSGDDESDSDSSTDILDCE